MSENLATVKSERPDPEAVAPVWHTAGVIILLLGTVALSMNAGRESRGGPSNRRVRGYIVTMTVEWAIVAFIGLGTRWQGASLRTLIGENSPCWRLIVRDLGLAVAFLVASNATLGILNNLLGRLIPPKRSKAMENLLPRSRIEIAAFLLLALSAGICEELIFRGYLQRQFTAWTKNAEVGVAAQAVAFGLVHAYQGPTQVTLIAVSGCMFGFLAHWRDSLRPCMMSHFLQDGVGGMLLARSLMK